MGADEAKRKLNDIVTSSSSRFIEAALRATILDRVAVLLSSMAKSTSTRVGLRKCLEAGRLSAKGHGAGGEGEERVEERLGPQFTPDCSARTGRFPHGGGREGGPQ